ncbi:MAG: hypothetical protein C4K47_07630 [Candidatus Thorarchaeota archaeon]|nr:MAG: hypothetical protein C4K47_07630 [Candidatus Thorarchaeota archaeon]
MIKEAWNVVSIKSCMNCAHKISSFASRTEGRPQTYVVCSRFGANKRETVLNSIGLPCWREHGKLD